MSPGKRTRLRNSNAYAFSNFLQIKHLTKLEKTGRLCEKNFPTE